MKRTQIFNIDECWFEKLKGVENKSKLINDLLKDYFEPRILDDLPEETFQKLKELTRTIEESTKERDAVWREVRNGRAAN